MTSRALTITNDQSQGPAAPLALKVTLLLAATLTIMAGTIVAPALPAIREAFPGEANVDLLSRMVLTLPALFVAGFAPVAGALADRFGRRKLLIFFVLLYAVAGMSGLYATSLTGILIGRAVLGLAIGGIMTIGAALVGDYFEGEERARFFGLQQAATQFGGVLFVVAGGMLADLDWRAPFAVYGLALFIVPAMVLFLTEPPRNAGVAADAKRSQTIWNWPLIGLVCLLAWLLNMLFYTVPAQIAFFLRDALDMAQPSVAGWAIGVMNLAAALTALSFGRLRARLPISAVFAICFGLMALGFAALCVATATPGVLFALAVAGLGIGYAIPNVLSAAIQVAPPAGRARVTGLVTSSMFLGHFLSPIVSQPVIAGIGYEGMYLAVGVAFAVMAFLALGVFAMQRRSQAGAA